MERKSQYKHKADDVSAIRNRNRNEDIALRKEKKDKLLSSKRFRFVDGEDITEEITHDEVISATRNLQKAGPHRKENLKTLRQAFSQGTAFIDDFFRYMYLRHTMGRQMVSHRNYLSRQILHLEHLLRQKPVINKQNISSLTSDRRRHGKNVENALTTLVGIYTGTEPDLQLEAAWCITNISAGTHTHAMSVTKYVAPYLVTYLGSGIHQLQDQSAWALGNLAGDSQECKKMVQAQGIVSPIVQLLQSPHPAVVQSAAFALSNLSKDSVDLSREMVHAGVIPMLLPHMQYSPENVDILSEVSWVFTYIATSGLFVEELSQHGVLKQIVNILVQLCGTKPHIAQVVTPLLRCLGNICSGPDEYTIQACENPQALSMLGEYLSSDLRHVKKETLWVLSNMTGEPNTCRAVVYSSLLSHILDQVQAAFDIKIEALYLLCNIACHGEENCTHLVDNGILQKVVPVLKSSDLEIVNLGLNLCEMALRNTVNGKEIFDRDCDGISKLEGLEYHSNDTIREHANYLLDHYYYGDEGQQGDVG